MLNGNKVNQTAPDRVNPMTMLSATKLVFLDVETTGLSPAMGDRVVELGMITCRGAIEISRVSHLVHPERTIPLITQRIHGISDQEVANCPLHRYEPSWRSEAAGNLPKALYDALTNGSRLSIRYVNAAGHSSARVIRPDASFGLGRHTYVRAFCENSRDMRTFRLDRIVIEAPRDSALPNAEV